MAAATALTADAIPARAAAVVMASGAGLTAAAVRTTSGAATLSAVTDQNWPLSSSRT